MTGPFARVEGMQCNGMTETCLALANVTGMSSLKKN
jgi:hypothetical protein